MTDAELIKGCLRDDRRSQNALYRKYFPLMSSIALRYTANADEAVAGVNAGFFKILQNLDQYNSAFALATFIRNIMVNHLIDEFRKEKKYIANIQLSDYRDSEVGVTFNQGEANVQADDLMQMLNTLPEVTRKVFNLFAIDGYKHTEIAEMMGIAEGTSKWHVNEARTKLKDLLEKHKIFEKKRSEIA